ncbi:MAG: FAD-binding protein, partial [Caulobacteraceae bacterium]|nr:FAD-binding protein [Caulobacteraceae bacterium]
MAAPTTDAEAQARVAEAAAARRTLEIVGQGTRRGLGRPVAADETLDLSSLRGITLYEPGELVLTARAGTPMADIEAALAEGSQRLAFEPPDLGPLWGAAEGLGTVGGMVSVGLAGSRRMTAGGVRDHLLGFRAVNGFGEGFAAGGRVVKNVTGFDLPKLMAGAFGTLGVLTEVTLKAMPAPEAMRTVLICGLDEAEGLSVLRAAVGGLVAATGAAHLPARTVDRTAALAPWRGGSATLLRVEGVGALAGGTAERLAAACGAAATAVLEDEGSARLWRAIGGGW